MFQSANYLISKNLGSSFIVDEVPICKERRVGKSIYTAQSIKSTEDFLRECVHLVQEPNIFWAALQSNCLSDVVKNTNQDLYEPLKQLKQSLIDLDVHVGTLSVNMRNSREIHNLEVVPGTLRSGFGGDVVTEVRTNIGIDKAKPTTVVGEIPAVIQVKNAGFSGAIKPILRNSLRSLHESSTQSSVVFLHDDSTTSADIQDKLKELNTFADVVLYPSSNDPQTYQNGLDEFLGNENIALITHEKYFRGCESRSVVYFCGNGENVRSSNARAVENLTIIQRLSAEYGMFTDDDHMFKNSRITKPTSHPNPIFWLLNHLENWSSKFA